MMSEITKCLDVAFKVDAISLVVNGGISLPALATELQIPFVELWRWRRDYASQVSLRTLTHQEAKEARITLFNALASVRRQHPHSAKIIVYTVAVGPINSLARFEPERDVQYVLFTDDLSTPAPYYWEKRLLANPERLPPRRLSRKPKIQPHLFLDPHEISVYLAPTVVIRRPILDFARSCVVQKPIALHRELPGSVLYNVGDDGLKWGVDDRQQLLDQLERYHKQGFADASEMIDDYIIVRRNTEAINIFNDFCWNEYINGSEREQLALAFGLWKQGIAPEFLGHDSRDNPWVVPPKQYPCNQMPPPMQRRYRGGRQNKGLLSLISHLPSEVRMVEIGSASGESAEIFATSGKINRMWCVDKWNETSIETEHEFDIVRGRHANIIGKCKMKSELAASYFSPQSLDFVYIDAAHAYEHISKDIGLWRPKIKPGGIIGGHDYTFKFRGVIRAIYEAFGRPSAVFEDGSWMVKLPTDTFGVVTWCPKEELATLECVIDSWLNNSGTSEVVVYTDGKEPPSVVKSRNNVRFVLMSELQGANAHKSFQERQIHAMEQYFKGTFHPYFAYLEWDCWVRTKLTDVFPQMADACVVGTRRMDDILDPKGEFHSGALFFRHDPLLHHFFQSVREKMAQIQIENPTCDSSAISKILLEAFDGLYPFHSAYVSDRLYNFKDGGHVDWLDDIEVIQPKIVRLLNEKFKDQWLKRTVS